MIFNDRIDAGRQLAAALECYKGDDALVFALPRGGVVVAAEIALALNVPLDLIVVCKVRHPLFPEYAVAAVAEDGHIVKNRAEVKSIDKQWFNESVRAEQQEAGRRRQCYTRGRTPISAAGKTAIIVDDGLANGLTMFAAIKEVRHFPTVQDHCRGTGRSTTNHRKIKNRCRRCCYPLCHCGFQVDRGFLHVLRTGNRRRSCGVNAPA